MSEKEFIQQGHIVWILDAAQMSPGIGVGIIYLQGIAGFNQGSRRGSSFSQWCTAQALLLR